jgi:hypothetical protein
MSRTGTEDRLVTTDTKITALFVVLGMALWYGSQTITSNDLVQFALLLGVGIVIPTIINEVRAKR